MQNLEPRIRRLASLAERMAILKTQDAGLREDIQKVMKEDKQVKVETLYGYVQIKTENVPDYSEFPEVALAQAALKAVTAQAMANVAAAVEKANATGKVPTKEKETFAFYRNKAVSARAIGNRVRVAQIATRAKRSRIYSTRIISPVQAGGKVGEVA